MITEEIKVGRFTAKFIFVEGKGFGCEWSPTTPLPGELSEKRLDEYREGRTKFLAKALPGKKILVAETDSNHKITRLQGPQQ